MSVELAGQQMNTVHELANLIRQKNWAARQQLLEFLRTMNPFKLEHLIKLLLEEMGYSNVKVTITLWT